MLLIVRCLLALLLLLRAAVSWKFETEGCFLQIYYLEACLNNLVLDFDLDKLLFLDYF